MADQERRVAWTSSTVWPIALVTKLFTGVAALQLVDSGDLALDQDINRYLRQIAVPARYPPITLAHLLSHTSGLDELPGRQLTRTAPPPLAKFLDGRLVRYRAPGSVHGVFELWRGAGWRRDRGRLGSHLRRIRAPTHPGTVRDEHRLMASKRRGDERVATLYAIEMVTPLRFRTSGT